MKHKHQFTLASHCTCTDFQPTYIPCSEYSELNSSSVIYSLITAISNTILSHWLSSGVGGSLWISVISNSYLLISRLSDHDILISRNFSQISGFSRPKLLWGDFPAGGCACGLARLETRFLICVARKGNPCPSMSMLWATMVAKDNVEVLNAGRWTIK